MPFSYMEDFRGFVGVVCGGDGKVAALLCAIKCLAGRSDPHSSLAPLHLTCLPRIFPVINCIGQFIIKRYRQCFPCGAGRILKDGKYLDFIHMFTDTLVPI